MSGNNPNSPWWKGAVFYQIYPRSFYDSNNDGIGDLPGITQKLEHLADLGVDGLWISPFFKSPMKDFGYDISDYRDVSPLFGTIDDFDKLLAKAHDLGIKIIIDIILSHTSKEHPWFIESRSSKDNPKADWYVWAPPKQDGTPPNNWRSLFGGEAWTFETRREEFYMHNFLPEQPDLNFHNPDVRDMMIDTCRFWLDKGIDGFRLDVINFIYHDKELRDNPPKDAGDTSSATQYEKLDPYSMQKHIYDKSRPEAIEFVQRLRKLMDEYPGTMTLGEIGDDHAVAAAAAYTSGNDKLHTAYSFALMTGDKLTAPLIQNAVSAFFEQPGDGYPSWAFCNHDVVRVASRWGSKHGYEHNKDFTKLVFALLCSLKGTAFIYQGEELGLTEAAITYEQLQDPWGKYLWPEWQGRDGCRTPIPWNAQKPHAGFSQAESTWLPIPQDHKDKAIATQLDDPDSMLRFAQAFLQWRTKHPVFKDGDIEFIATDDEELLHFTRSLDGKIVHCIFNLSSDTKTMELSAYSKETAITFHNKPQHNNSGQITLPPFAFVYSF